MNITYAIRPAGAGLILAGSDSQFIANSKLIWLEGAHTEFDCGECIGRAWQSDDLRGLDVASALDQAARVWLEGRHRQLTKDPASLFDDGTVHVHEIAPDEDELPQWLFNLAISFRPLVERLAEFDFEGPGADERMRFSEIVRRALRLSGKVKTEDRASSAEVTANL